MTRKTSIDCAIQAKYVQQKDMPACKHRLFNLDPPSLHLLPGSLQGLAPFLVELSSSCSWPRM